MKITILTTFPEMFTPLHTSMLGRAEKAGILEIREVDIRAYSKNKHHNTDDAPFGGGAGMVMLAQPIVDAIRDVQGGRKVKRIYLSPRGETLTQKKAEQLAKEDELILLCGHYEGVDQRARDLCIDEELSDRRRAGRDGAGGLRGAACAGRARLRGERADGELFFRSAGISAVHPPA